MRLFGKKANPQSAKSEVPPELQPYYDPSSQPSRPTKLSRRSLLVIAAILLVVVGGTLLGLWLHGSNSSHNSLATKGGVAQIAPNQRTGPSHKATTGNGSINTPTPQSSGTKVSPA